MENLNSSQVLKLLAHLRHTAWLQGFTLTPEQEAQMAALRRLRWARVKEITG